MSDKRKRKNERDRRLAAESQAATKRRRRAYKAETRRQRDAIVATALSNYQSDEKRFAKSDLDYRIKRAILRRARKLMDPRFEPVLRLLGNTTWIRDIKEWKPKGKSPSSLFKSLVRHLLVKYTMPDFMFSVFFEDEDVRHVGMALFVDLGSGGSLYKAVKDARFPVPLTKRMCHVFMQSTTKLRFLEAVRHAQVCVLGGGRRLAGAVTTTRQLGRGFKPNEDFWTTVIQWACNQAMLAPSQIPPIFDWVSRQRQETEAFSMKGRTGLSVLRAVEGWHGTLARERKINGHQYDPSGFEAWFHERKVRLPSGGHHMERHCVTEVATSKELAEEGAKLRHCVYSYSSSIQRGNVSIWSYKVDGTRALTIEVDNKNKRVLQCLGKSNRVPAPSEMAQVGRWMKENGLVRAS